MNLASSECLVGRYFAFDISNTNTKWLRQVSITLSKEVEKV